MARRLAIAVLIVTVAGTIAARLHSQSPQASDPKPVAFEVATIKENKSADNNSLLSRPPGGRVSATNVPLRFLITFAYALPQRTEVIAGPDWMNSIGYDIVAKLEGNPPVVPPGSGIDPARLAMRTLLADRFKLKFHRDKKQADIYALVLARPGVVGPSLKPSTQDCAAAVEAQRRNNGVSPPGAPFCGFSGGPGRIKFGGLPSSQIAAALMNYAGRDVVDRTGLTGSWEFELNFAQESGPPGPEAPAPSDAPSLFTAIQEQLGLKLESAKAPVDVLVIDHVEKPTPD
jgi:uncharacterized protein (TIGR03435 family)